MTIATPLMAAISVSSTEAQTPAAAGDFLAMLDQMLASMASPGCGRACEMPGTSAPHEQTSGIATEMPRPISRVDALADPESEEAPPQIKSKEEDQSETCAIAAAMAAALSSLVPVQDVSTASTEVENSAASAPVLHVAAEVDAASLHASTAGMSLASGDGNPSQLEVTRGATATPPTADDVNPAASVPGDESERVGVPNGKVHKHQPQATSLMVDSTMAAALKYEVATDRITEHEHENVAADYSQSPAPEDRAASDKEIDGASSSAALASKDSTDSVHPTTAVEHSIDPARSSAPDAPPVVSARASAGSADARESVIANTTVEPRRESAPEAKDSTHPGSRPVVHSQSTASTGAPDSMAVAAVASGKKNSDHRTTHTSAATFSATSQNEIANNPETVANTTATGPSESIGEPATTQADATRFIRLPGHSEVRIAWRTHEYGHVDIAAVQRNTEVHAVVKIQDSDLRAAFTAELPSVGSAPDTKIDIESFTMSDSNNGSNSYARHGSAPDRQNNRSAPRVIRAMRVPADVVEATQGIDVLI